MLGEFTIMNQQERLNECLELDRSGRFAEADALFRSVVADIKNSKRVYRILQQDREIVGSKLKQLEEAYDRLDLIVANPKAIAEYAKVFRSYLSALRQYMEWLDNPRIDLDEVDGNLHTYVLNDEELMLNTSFVKNLLNEKIAEVMKQPLDFNSNPNLEEGQEKIEEEITNTFELMQEMDRVARALVTHSDEAHRIGKDKEFNDFFRLLSNMMMGLKGQLQFFSGRVRFIGEEVDDEDPDNYIRTYEGLGGQPYTMPESVYKSMRQYVENIWAFLEEIDGFDSEKQPALLPEVDEDIWRNLEPPEK